MKLKSQTENIGGRARLAVSVFAGKYHSPLCKWHIDRYYGSKENSCVPESIAIHFTYEVHYKLLLFF